MASGALLLAACTLQSTPIAPAVTPTPWPPAPSGECGPDAEVPEAPVFAFFTCRDLPADGRPVAYPVPRAAGAADLLSRLEAALIALFEGPTRDEQALGYASFFSRESAGALGQASIEADGTAIVDLRDIRLVLGNASTATGSEALLAQLNGTVFQFEEISAVDYRINGSCMTFWEWLQRVCHTVQRP